MTLFNSNSVETYAKNTPKMDIKSYFDGDIKAWGIVQDWRGRVVSRFEVDMVGSWQGDSGTLHEKFVYDDGKIQERVWSITKLSDERYEGRASDIIDKAEGFLSGNAASWRYVMDLPVDDKIYRIKFDDWMWLMNDDILINRSYLKKFGITVSELSIFMQKTHKNHAVQ